MASQDGLGRLRDGHVTLYKTRDGLADNVVIATLEDSGSAGLTVGFDNDLDRAIHEHKKRFGFGGLRKDGLTSLQMPYRCCVINRHKLVFRPTFNNRRFRRSRN